MIDAHTHIYRKINGLISEGPVKGLEYGKAIAGNSIISVLPPLNKHVEYMPEMLNAAMEEAGVERAVLLQGPFYGECNYLVAKTVKKYGKKYAGMAYIDPWEIGFNDKFEYIISKCIFRGFKIECSVSTGFFGVHKEASLYDPEVKWLCKRMESKGLVLTLDLGAPGTRSYQTSAVRKLASEHSGLKIVICHLGQPSPVLNKDRNLLELWKDQITLGLLPNIWFDTASIPAYFQNECYPFPGGTKYFNYAIDIIGAGKILWGTDVPGLMVHATYRQLVQLGEIYTENLPLNDKSMVLYENARKVYFAEE